jgi:hypothetical protein
VWNLQAASKAAPNCTTPNTRRAQQTPPPPLNTLQLPNVSQQASSVGCCLHVQHAFQQRVKTCTVCELCCGGGGGCARDTTAVQLYSNSNRNSNNHLWVGA